MADETTNTPTAAPPAEPSAPPTPAPDNSNAVPELYSDYLKKQEYVEPIVKLPLAEKIQLFNAVKPKDAGDTLALGVAKTYLNKQKEVVHAPDVALGNRMLKQNADVLDGIGRDYGLKLQPEELTPTQQADVTDRTKEFNQQLQKMYGIPKGGLKEGMILPIPKGWNAPELRKIKFAQPNWSGEYIQLRTDPQTGEPSWEGYNKPSAGTQTLSPVKVIADTTGKKWDGKKWVKAEPDEKSVSAYWDKEYNSPDVSDGAIRLSGVLHSEQKEGNYRLTKLMQDNPSLAQEYKNQLESAAPESVSTAGGNITLLQNAVKKTYDLDKNISDVQKSFSDYQFNLAIDAYDQFNDFAHIYDKQQDALAAKIITVSDTLLRKSGKGKDIDDLFQLRAQMMRNPGSLTPQEKQRYYDLSLGLIKESSKLQEVAPYIEQFNKNIDDYKTAYTKSVKESALLSTPDGKKALDLLQKQAVGINLYNNILNYFPKAKAQAAEQAKIDQMASDKVSLFKSLVRGMNTSFEDLSKGREQWAQWLGIMSPNDVIQEQRDIVPKYDNLTNKLYTPNRPEQDDKGKDLWGNKIANFFDGAMEFTGNMTPYLISGGAGAASIIPETGMFFTSGYNDYYREAKEQGLNNQDAAIKAAIAGTTLALTQLFLPKSQLVQRKAINTELESLLRKSARPDASALSTFFGRFVNPEVFQATYKGGLAVFSNDVAQNLINEYYNAAKGTSFKTDTDMGKMVEQSLMFGVMASMTNGLFKGSSKTEQLAARNALLAHAERYPVESLRSIDDAITLSYTDAHYDRSKLLDLKTDIASMHQMQFPKDFTQDQKVATWALKKQKTEWKEDMGKLHEAERGIYENKLEEIDGQIREIASDPAKATEYMNNTAEPLYRRLEKQGYFDNEGKQGDFVLARHGQTDANFKGLINSDTEPLNQEGILQAHELGQQLKDEGYKDAMYSPHTRAEQTADAVVSETGGRKIANNDLREWNRGEGADADFDYKHYVENPDERPSGGETFNEFLGRIQKVRDVAIPDKTAVITHGKVMKLWESLDKSGGKWDETAKTEFLKDSNDFENAEIYKPKVVEQTPEGAKEAVQQQRQGYQPIKDKPAGEKTKEAAKLPFDTYKEHMLNFIEGAKESEFDWRVTEPNLSQKDRDKGVADIKAGKESAAAKKVEKLIKDSYDAGTITVNRGRGNNAQTVEFTHDEWFGTGEPLDAKELEAADKLSDDDVRRIIEDEGLTKDNIDNLKNIFSGYLYDEADFKAVKDYLQRQGESDAANKADREKSDGKKEALDRIDADIENAPESERKYHEQRKALVDKYGKDIDEMIEDLKKQERLKVDCPPGTKRRFSLRSLLKS